MARLDPMARFDPETRRARRRGRARLTGSAIVVTAAVVVVVLAVNRSTREYTPSAMLHRSLPAMLRLYGGNARLASLSVTDDTVRYQVLTTHGTLVGREFACTRQDCPGGDGHPVPAGSGALLRQAQLTLGELRPTVPSTLLARLYLSANGTTLRLQGRQWTITSGGSHWTARADGTGIRQLAG